MDDTEVKDERVETVLQERVVGQCTTHQWILADPDPNSELVGLQCANCSTGILVSKENVKRYIS